MFCSYYSAGVALYRALVLPYHMVQAPHSEPPEHSRSLSLMSPFRSTRRPVNQSTTQSHNHTKNHDGPATDTPATLSAENEVSCSDRAGVGRHRCCGLLRVGVRTPRVVGSVVVSPPCRIRPCRKRHPSYHAIDTST